MTAKASGFTTDESFQELMKTIRLIDEWNAGGKSSAPSVDTPETVAAARRQERTAMAFTGNGLD